MAGRVERSSGRGLAAPGRLSIAVQKSVPVGFGEAVRGQSVSNLLQRSPQPDEIGIAPQAGPAQLATVEIHQIHGVLAEKHVVRVEVGVTHAEVMEAPDTT